jgi:hypothetical protein
MPWQPKSGGKHLRMELVQIARSTLPSGTWFLDDPTNPVFLFQASSTLVYCCEHLFYPEERAEEHLLALGTAATQGEQRSGGSILAGTASHGTSELHGCTHNLP